MFVRQDPHHSSDAVRLPITQAELAEATGLTSVHVNRTLRELRMAHGVSTRGKRLSIRNFAALSKLADHQRDYLGLSPLDAADGERMLIGPDLGFYAGSDAGDHGSRSAPHGWSVGSR
ncbi:helix-turn-helix domain-containing protein [Sphingopyxis fribergensis]